MPREKEEDLAPSGKRLAEIFEFGPVPSKNRSSLDQAIQDEDERRVRDAKRLELDVVMAQRKKELSALTGAPTGEGMSVGFQGGGNPAAQIIGALTAQGKSPEEVNAYVRALSPEALAAMSAASSNNPMAAMMMFAMTRNNPSNVTPMGVKEIVELVNLVSGPKKNDFDAVQLVKLIKEVNPSQGGDTMTMFNTMVKPLIDELQKSRMTDLEKKIEELRNQPSGVERMKQLSEELKAIQEITGGGVGGQSSTVTLELEKMRLDHERFKAEHDWELQKMGLENAGKKARWDTMMNSVLKPVIQRAGPLIEEAMKQGKQAIRTRGPVGQQSQPPAPELVEFICQTEGCGNTIWLNDPPPPEFTCPKCGAVYSKEPRKTKIGEYVPPPPPSSVESPEPLDSKIPDPKVRGKPLPQPPSSAQVKKQDEPLPAV